jgi:uncharacterized protein
MLDQILALGWVFWVLAIIGTLLTGISKSGFAGGIGVISVPLLATQIGPIRAAALMLPLLLLMDFFSVKAWWGKQLNEHLKHLLPASMVGIFIGYLLFDYLDDRILTFLLGVFSVVFSVHGLMKGARFKPHRSTRWVGRISGMVAGFTSFLAHAGGPPLNYYLIPLKLPRAQYLGTAVVFFASINVAKLLPYSLLGQVNFENLLIGLILAPVAWIGIRAGLVIQHKLNDVVFYKSILVMLFLVGVKLIVDPYL